MFVILFDISTLPHTHTHIYIYIYIYIYKSCWIKGDFGETSKMQFFQNLFYTYNLSIFWNWFIAKIILISKNICIEAIQNGSKSKRVIRAWTEICHQIFGDWEEPTMRNLLNNLQCVRSSIYYSDNTIVGQHHYFCFFFFFFFFGFPS